jgi:alpha-tubulin suppressor-like RCC1 family protein
MPASSNYTPINLSEVRNFDKSILEWSSSDTHTLIITTSGELWGWGNNTNNELGLGTADTLVPRGDAVRIGSASNWTKIAAGQNFSLGVNSSGELYSWGFNGSGRTGRSLTTGNTSTPTRVGTATNWTSVAAGTSSAYAIASGQLWAWGNNSNAQLGNGNTTQQTAPLRIGSASNWATVVAGELFAVAVNTSTQLFVWGLNTNGRTGRNLSSGNTTTPTLLSSAGAVSKISIANNGQYVLMINTSGQLRGWGNNGNGQLGNGSTSAGVFVPTTIGSASNWSEVSCGFSHSGVINSSGELYVAGSNGLGQLGLGNFTQTTSLTKVGTATNWSKVRFHPNFASIAITTSGNVFGWGSNNQSQLITPVQVVDAQEIEISITTMPDKLWGSHVAAIANSGELWSWGLNSNGATGLGINDSSRTLVPTRVGSANNWTKISCAGHTLAINASGELWAWGLNNFGQLGRNNTTSPQTTPVRIGSASNWTEVSAGSNHSLAINSLGELYAWGLNTTGRTGLGLTSGNTLVPTRVGTASNWTKISADNTHNLALNTAGELWGWGGNTVFELGFNSSGSPQTTPIQMGSASNWTQISAGQNYSLAINSLGELYSCGTNTNGVTGQGTTTGTTTTLTRVGSLSNYSKLGAGTSHAFAITTSKTLLGWGLNSQTRLGIVTLPAQTLLTTPTQIGTDSDWSSVTPGTNFTLALKE